MGLTDEAKARAIKKAARKRKTSTAAEGEKKKAKVGESSRPAPAEEVPDSPIRVEEVPRDSGGRGIAEETQGPGDTEPVVVAGGMRIIRTRTGVPGAVASSSRVLPGQKVDSGGSQAPPRGRDPQVVPGGGSLERSGSQGGAPGQRRTNPDEATGGKIERCFRNREDGDQWAVDVRMGKRDSLLSSRGMTRKMLEAVLPPADREHLASLKTETMVDHMLHEAAKVAFGLLDFKNRLNHREEIRLGLLEKVKSAEARERLKDAELREAQAELEKVRKMQAHDELRRKMAESRAIDLEGRAHFAEEKLEAETEKSSQLRICLRASEKKASDQTMELINLSDRFRERGSRISELESENQRLEAVAESAEEAARVAGEKALAEFRASSEYEDERAEAGTEMYYDGFNACKAAVSNAFPNLNLQAILPPEYSSSDSSEGEEEENVAVAEDGRPPIEAPHSSPGPMVPSATEVEAVPVPEVDSPEVEILEETGVAAIGSPLEAGEVVSSPPEVEAPLHEEAGAAATEDPLEADEAMGGPPQVDAEAAGGEREEEMAAIGTPSAEHPFDFVDAVFSIDDLTM